MNKTSQISEIVARLRRCDTPLDQVVASLLESQQLLISRMRAALMQAEDYFDGRADVVDGSYGEPSPNTEMQILSEIRCALEGNP